MNIYWCHELDDDYGMFVAANTPSKAKYLFSDEDGCAYKDVRYHCVKKNAITNKEETLPRLEEYILQVNGLHYLDENRLPIKNHECVDTQLVPVSPVLEGVSYVYYGTINRYGYDEPVYQKVKIKNAVTVPCCKVCDAYLYHYDPDFVYCPYCGSFIIKEGDEFDGSMESNRRQQKKKVYYHGIDGQL